MCKETLLSIGKSTRGEEKKQRVFFENGTRIQNSVGGIENY